MVADQLGDSYDVVVAGGGAAGLSGALMLARSRRSVVVIDAGAPRNAPAAGVHGFLSQDGIRPGELLERGRDEVRRYGGQVVPGEVGTVTREERGFTVTLATGRAVRARRLLVATGLADELPDIPGLRARWGRDVVHCPYCHGWEVRDQAIGVLASGPLSVHQALLFRQLSADVAGLHAHRAAAGRRGGGAAGRPRHHRGGGRGGGAGDRRGPAGRSAAGRRPGDQPPGAGGLAADGRAGWLPGRAGPAARAPPERGR